MKQGSQEWLEWRKKGIGASDASVVMGIDPYRTRDDLFLEKTGRGVPMKKNRAMDFGNQFEGAARALLFFERGHDFEPYFLSHPDLPWLRASLDGFNEDQRLLAEIKYLGVKNFELIQLTQSPLKHHFPQVQQQLLVTGFKDAVYVPYTLTKNQKAIDKIQFVNILRDDRYINEELLPALTTFWDEVTTWITKNQSNEL